MANSEIKQIWERIVNVEKNNTNLYNFYNQTVKALNDLKEELVEVSKRSPEYEKEAQQSSKKTSEYRNRASDTLDDAKAILENILLSQSEITLIKNDFDNLHNLSINHFEDLKSDQEQINTIKNEVLERIENINKSIKLFEKTIENHPDFEEEISELENNISIIKDNESKSSQLVKSITSRKIELDTLYNEILGYSSKDEDTDEEIFIEGTKQTLENSLEVLETRTINFEQNFNDLEKSTQNNLNNLLQINSNKIANQIDQWEEKYNSLNKKIENLLPNALTAGLSHAFTKKKEEEDKSYQKHKSQFSYGIIGMIIVSLIPFIISAYTLIKDTNLDIVINRVPKFVVAILPLYIPVLWLSISSSKKMNLSKRLIEEYSHKEVLSKTFEGLSRQIKDLGEDDISNELKIRLLQDFLQMYSENPGKLISDYNSSDHPVMELLENSNKLEKTITKLEKIPGMHKVAELLEKKSEKKIEQATDIIEKNLDRVLGMNKNIKEEEEEEIS
ncbi:hypothetical protein [Elizabethkingia anophelis]|uniref:hypothetical protein n=1 Tax=Elizabethkingia anophelis TaxID=1117645 RepID=UPI000442BFB1|nr:hypothetical protein [Elizabethkingia anophelis]MDV3752326.1 hypothetical protein [Elizabethkingia anophelis]UTF92810.1 hypothetical protein J2O08_16670 [Elizabethkingia anophelis]CDN76088.1 conserved hypothetical protein [Elizabethkingia anophelis]CDN79944.1 conserved hypothetical protein [Elizabethkingia anophelis]